MLGILEKMKIKTKILTVVGACMLSLVGISVFSIYQINKIGQEITSIAEQDIPLTRNLTQISTHQLEQTVRFERMLKFVLEAKTDPHAVTSYQKAVKAFNSYGHKVTKEIKHAEQQAKHAADKAHSGAERKEFTHILHALQKVEKEHASFETHVHAVIKSFAAGKIAEGIRQGEKIEAEVEKLDHEIGALVTEIATFTDKAAKTAEAHEHTALLWLSIMSVLTFLLVGTAAWIVISRFLIGPLGNVVHALQELIGGNTEIVVKVEYPDEIGQVAEGLEAFRKKLIENQALEAQTNENQKQAAKRTMKIDELNTTFNADVADILGSVASATAQLNETATSMSSASEETLAQSSVILKGAEESAQNIQSVASATEQLTGSIQEIGRQTAESSNMSRQAVERAKGAQSQVGQLVENSQKIGEVVSLISDIAEQTNLLALNATIEAARAGEMGKGFAVVANEVKSLASQTAKATEEISIQIEAMQNMTTGTAGAIEDIVVTINGVDEIISTIASAMEEQNSATQEIAQNVQQASAGAQEITSNVHGVNEAAGTTGESANFVLEATKNLADQSDRLRSQIDGYLEDVRTA